MPPNKEQQLEDLIKQQTANQVAMSKIEALLNKKQGAEQIKEQSPEVPDTEVIKGIEDRVKLSLDQAEGSNKDRIDTTSRRVENLGPEGEIMVDEEQKQLALEKLDQLQLRVDDLVERLNKLPQDLKESVINQQLSLLAKKKKLLDPGKIFAEQIRMARAHYQDSKKLNLKSGQDPLEIIEAGIKKFEKSLTEAKSKEKTLSAESHETPDQEFEVNGVTIKKDGLYVVYHPNFKKHLAARCISVSVQDNSASAGFDFGNNDQCIITKQKLDHLEGYELISTEKIETEEIEVDFTKPIKEIQNALIRRADQTWKLNKELNKKSRLILDYMNDFNHQISTLITKMHIPSETFGEDIDELKKVNQEITNDLSEHRQFEAKINAAIEAQQAHLKVDAAEEPVQEVSQVVLKEIQSINPDTTESELLKAYPVGSEIKFSLRKDPNHKLVGSVENAVGSKLIVRDTSSKKILHEVTEDQIIPEPQAPEQASERFTDVSFFKAGEEYHLGDNEAISYTFNEQKDDECLFTNSKGVTASFKVSDLEKWGFTPVGTETPKQETVNIGGVVPKVDTEYTIPHEKTRGVVFVYLKSAGDKNYFTRIEGGTEQEVFMTTQDIINMGGLQEVKAPSGAESTRAEAYQEPVPEPESAPVESKLSPEQQRRFESIVARVGEIQQNLPPAGTDANCLACSKLLAEIGNIELRLDLAPEKIEDIDETLAKAEGLLQQAEEFYEKIISPAPALSQEQEVLDEQRNEILRTVAEILGPYQDKEIFVDDSSEAGEFQSTLRQINDLYDLLNNPRAKTDINQIIFDINKKIEALQNLKQQLDIQEQDGEIGIRSKKAAQPKKLEHIFTPKSQPSQHAEGHGVNIHFSGGSVAGGIHIDRQGPTAQPVEPTQSPEPGTGEGKPDTKKSDPDKKISNTEKFQLKFKIGDTLTVPAFNVGEVEGKLDFSSGGLPVEQGELKHYEIVDPAKRRGYVVIENNGVLTKFVVIFNEDGTGIEENGRLNAGRGLAKGENPNGWFAGKDKSLAEDEGVRINKSLKNKQVELWSGQEGLVTQVHLMHNGEKNDKKYRPRIVIEFEGGQQEKVFIDEIKRIVPEKLPDNSFEYEGRQLPVTGTLDGQQMTVMGKVLQVEEHNPSTIPGGLLMDVKLEYILEGRKIVKIHQAEWKNNKLTILDPTGPTGPETPGPPQELEPLNDPEEFKQALNEGNKLDTLVAALGDISLDDLLANKLSAEAKKGVIDNLVNKMKMDKNSANALIEGIPGIYHEHLMSKAKELQDEAEGAGKKGMEAFKHQVGLFIKEDIKKLLPKTAGGVVGLAASLKIAALATAAVGLGGSAIAGAAVTGLSMYGLVFAGKKVGGWLAKKYRKFSGKAEEGPIKQEFIQQARQEVNQEIGGVVAGLCQIEFQREQDLKRAQKLGHEMPAEERLGENMDAYLELNLKANVWTIEDLKKMTGINQDKLQKYLQAQGKKANKQVSEKEIFLPADFDWLKDRGFIDNERKFKKAFNEKQTVQEQNIADQQQKLVASIQAMGRKYLENFNKIIDVKNLTPEQLADIENIKKAEATKYMTRLMQHALGENRFARWLKTQMQGTGEPTTLEKFIKSPAGQLLTRGEGMFGGKTEVSKASSKASSYAIMAGLYGSFGPWAGPLGMALASGAGGWMEFHREKKKVSLSEMESVKKAKKMKDDLDQLYGTIGANDLSSQLATYRANFKAARNYYSEADAILIEQKIRKIETQIDLTSRMSNYLTRIAEQTKTTKQAVRQEKQKITRLCTGRNLGKLFRIVGKTGLSFAAFKFGTEAVTDLIEKGTYELDFTRKLEFKSIADKMGGVHQEGDDGHKVTMAGIKMSESGNHQPGMDQEIYDNLYQKYTVSADALEAFKFATANGMLPTQLDSLSGKLIHFYTEHPDAAKDFIESHQADFENMTVQQLEQEIKTAEQNIEHKQTAIHENIAQDYLADKGASPKAQDAIRSFFGFTQNADNMEKAFEGKNLTPQEWDNVANNLKSVQDVADEYGIDGKALASYIANNPESFFDHLRAPQDVDTYTFDDVLKVNLIKLDSAAGNWGMTDQAKTDFLNSIIRHSDLEIDRFTPVFDKAAEHIPEGIRAQVIEHLGLDQAQSAQELNQSLDQLKNPQEVVAHFEEELIKDFETKNPEIAKQTKIFNAYNNARHLDDKYDAKIVVDHQTGEVRLELNGVGEKGNYLEQACVKLMSHSGEEFDGKTSNQITELKSQDLNAGANLVKAFQTNGENIKAIFGADSDAYKHWQAMDASFEDGKIVINNPEALDDLKADLQHHAVDVASGSTAYLDNSLDSARIVHEDGRVEQVDLNAEMINNARARLVEAQAQSVGLPLGQGNLYFNTFDQGGFNEHTYSFDFDQSSGGHRLEIQDNTITQFWPQDSRPITLDKPIDLANGWENAKGDLAVVRLTELGEQPTSQAQEFVVKNFDLQKWQIRDVFQTNKALKNIGFDDLDQAKIMRIDQGIEVDTVEHGPQIQLRWGSPGNKQMIEISKIGGQLMAKDPGSPASPIDGDYIYHPISQHDLLNTNKLDTRLDSLGQETQADQDAFNKLVEMGGKPWLRSEPSLAKIERGVDDLAFSLHQVTVEDLVDSGELNKALTKVCTNEQSKPAITRIMNKVQENFKQQGIIDSKGHVAENYQDMTVGQILSGRQPIEHKTTQSPANSIEAKQDMVPIIDPDTKQHTHNLTDLPADEKTKIFDSMDQGFATQAKAEIDERLNILKNTTDHDSKAYKQAARWFTDKQNNDDFSQIKDFQTGLALAKGGGGQEQQLGPGTDDDEVLRLLGINREKAVNTPTNSESNERDEMLRSLGIKLDKIITQSSAPEETVHVAKVDINEQNIEQNINSKTDEINGLKLSDQQKNMLTEIARDTDMTPEATNTQLRKVLLMSKMSDYQKFLNTKFPGSPEARALNNLIDKLPDDYNPDIKSMGDFLQDTKADSKQFDTQEIEKIISTMKFK